MRVLLLFAYLRISLICEHYLYHYYNVRVAWLFPVLSLLSNPALIFKLTSVCVQVSKEVTVCQTGFLEFLSDCCVCSGTCSSSLITTYLNYTCFQYWKKSPPSEIVSFFPLHAGLFSFTLTFPWNIESRLEWLHFGSHSLNCSRLQPYLRRISLQETCISQWSKLVW